MRLAAGSAWLATGMARRIVPDLIGRYPERVGELFGERVSPDDARRLVRERLSVLVARRVVAHALTSPSGHAFLRARVEVAGIEHLRAAVAGGRGVVLVSTHFGFPHLTRPILDGMGIRHLHAKLQESRPGQVTVKGDAWARLAAIKRFRSAIADGVACTLLVDGRMGSPVQMPFFGKETTVTLGAFYLGQATGVPILPYFGLMPDHRSRFRVEITPPLTPVKGSSAAALTAMAREFFATYQTYARRYPSHLPLRLVRAGADDPA